MPNEIAAPFWVEWRKLVKGINPDAYISGEIWDRAEQWLDGQHFDAVMNYEFARPTVAWIFNRQHKITPERDRPPAARAAAGVSARGDARRCRTCSTATTRTASPRWP